MTKQELIKTFYDNHLEVVDYINTLTDDQFTSSHNGKWTAGQQYNHIYLTILPFTRALASKDFILQKFGKINRPTWDYDTVIENYFKTSRQAPQQYLPEETGAEQRTKITAGINETLEVIQQHLEQFTEEELDTLILPHPLLGSLTIREMFYLMGYHAIHHLKQIVQNPG